MYGLPEGIWFISVKVETDRAVDGFVYTANLEHGVRAAARQDLKKPVEMSSSQRVADKLKHIVDSVQNIKDALGELALLDDLIDRDSKISDGDKRLLKKEVQVKREALIRQLRE